MYCFRNESQANRAKTTYRVKDNDNLMKLFTLKTPYKVADLKEQLFNGISLSGYFMQLLIISPENELSY